jgi:protein involved in ribonucleotide reduction
VNGVSAILDMYNLNGSSYSSAEPNSMSIVGTAGVGALSSASYSTLSNAAWQFVLDGANRASLDTVIATGATAYSWSYGNATVGLLTLLTMSGNFYPM